MTWTLSQSSDTHTLSLSLSLSLSFSTQLLLQGKPDHELMLDESLEMMEQLASTAVRCAKISADLVEHNCSHDSLRHTAASATLQAVSYTHLTLPTTPYV